MQKRTLNRLHAFSPFAVAQFPADVTQAAKSDHTAKCSSISLYRFLDAAVHDDRVELVGERAGLSVFAVVGDFPQKRGRIVHTGFLDIDRDLASFSEPMDRIPRQCGLRADCSKDI